MSSGRKHARTRHFSSWQRSMNARVRSRARKTHAAHADDGDFQIAKFSFCIIAFLARVPSRAIYEPRRKELFVVFDYGFALEFPACHRLGQKFHFSEKPAGKRGDALIQHVSPNASRAPSQRAHEKRLFHIQGRTGYSLDRRPRLWESRARAGRHKPISARALCTAAPHQARLATVAASLPTSVTIGLTSS